MTSTPQPGPAQPDQPSSAPPPGPHPGAYPHAASGPQPGGPPFAGPQSTGPGFGAPQAAQPGRPVGAIIRPLRDLSVYALIGAPAIWLFVAIIRLIPSGVGLTFLTRAQNSFYSYINLEIILMPLAAVVLAHVIQPRHRQARLVTLIALIEYAVAAFFAVVFGFLIAIVKIAASSIRIAFEELLVRVAWLAVFALAAYAVFLIWRTLYSTPKPQFTPGQYGGPQPPAGQGQPGQGQPGQGQYGQPGYPGQPPYGQPAGSSAPGAAPGFPQPGSSPGFPQPGAAAGSPPPGSWGQPPSWGGPTSPQPPVGYPQHAPGAPASAPPAFAPPASAPPASAPPASGAPAFGPPPSGPSAFSGSGQSAAPSSQGPAGPASAAAYPASAYPASSQPSSPPGPFAPSPGHPHGVQHSSNYSPGAPESSAGGYAEPTEVISSGDQDDDRTHILREDPPRN